MTNNPNNPNNPELPERLTQDLRALGGAKAPEELWERVQLGLALGQVEKAPEELWGQVQLGLALGEVEKAPADLWSRVQPQLAAIAEPESQKPAGRVLHNQAWGRRLSIAAALMICAGIGYRFMGPAQVDPGAALAGPVSAADRAAFRAKVVFMEVSSKELSSVANSFAEGFGGITAEDDA